MLMSCILAFFLNYCIFLNTTLNSAVTQTICGNLKVCSPMNLFILLSFLIHLAGSILQLEKVQSIIMAKDVCGLVEESESIIQVVKYFALFQLELNRVYNCKRLCYFEKMKGDFVFCLHPCMLTRGFLLIGCNFEAWLPSVQVFGF